MTQLQRYRKVMIEPFKLCRGGFCSTILLLPFIFTGCSQLPEKPASDNLDTEVSESAQSSILSYQSGEPSEENIEPQSSDPVTVSNTTRKPATLEGLSLVLAARYGQLNVVNNLVNQGIDVDLVDEMGNTALIAAAQQEHQEVMEKLISRGANVNASANDGSTALMAAASMDNLAAVKLLVKTGAIIDIGNNSGETALVNAVKHGHLSMVNYLLAKGADPNVRNVDRFIDGGGITPLMIAASHGLTNEPADWLGIVRSLVVAGADVRTVRINGDSAITIADDNGFQDIVKELTHGGAYDESSYVALDRGEALLKAVKKEDVKKVKDLLANGADANYRDHLSGITPLLVASYKGNYLLVKMLVNHGAEIDYVPFGLRPERISASNIPLHERDLLMAATRGETPLLVAVRNGDQSTVKFLLDNDANISLPNCDDETPSLIAARSGRADIMDILLKRGADPNMALLKKEIDPSVANPRKEKFNSLLIEASTRGHAALAMKLLDSGGNPNIRDRKGKTALHWAATEGQLNMVINLLNRNADANVNDIDGRSPLMSAAKSGYVSIVRVLLQNDARVNAMQRKTPILGEHEGEGGMSALFFASRGGHKKIVRMLLDYGANQDVKTPSGRTALEVAGTFGHDEVVELLVNY